MIGDLDAAHQRRLDETEAAKRSSCPAVDVIGSELEALRIDIRRGQVALALAQVEARLAQVEAWWQQDRSGQRVPEAPNPEVLARVLIGTLDVAQEAYFAQKDWEPALRRIDDMLEVKRALERPAEDIAGGRTNRAIVLRHLGRFGEAQTELEVCLQVFQNNPTGSSVVLSSLAALFDDQGDVVQAITQERRALALCEQLPDPYACAISHNNLADYLEHRGTPSALAESSRHQLAALIYRLVAGLGQHLQSSLRNYAVRFRRAQAAGTLLTVPRVAELLADPVFRPLDDWLRQRQVGVAEVQAVVDRALDMIRQAALGQT
jgi:tetratricopeptide (TPR) repeat protein